MDISNWSEAEILQLPDHLFGRRWISGLAHYWNDANVHFAMSKAALPEWTIFWDYWCYCHIDPTGVVHTSIRFGDKIPGSDAEFYSLEPVFSQANRMAQSDFVHYAQTVRPVHFRMKDLKHTSGRRIITRGLRTVGAATVAHGLYFQISSVPKSLPKWFI